MSHSAQK